MGGCCQEDRAGAELSRTRQSAAILKAVEARLSRHIVEDMHGETASAGMLRFSAAHRQMMDLVYYHDRSVDETAVILGISPNTVKTRMFYARGKMDGLLRQAGVEGL